MLESWSLVGVQIQGHADLAATRAYFAVVRNHGEGSSERVNVRFEALSFIRASPPVARPLV